MIEIIREGFPGNVVALRAHGTVEHRDYEEVLVPAVESAIATHGKIRFLYHVPGDFTGYTAGAMWDDAKVGLGHLTAFEKVAVVTDVAWMRNAVNLFRFLIPCPVKIFANAEFTEAAAWIND
jgi:hypothetical protein